jgi:hypothetical protein
MPAFRLAICTVATHSHLALAVTMLESARTAMPDVALYLLLVEAQALPPQRASALAALGVRVLHAARLLDEAALSRTLERYTAAEVCFALKPVLIQHLLAQGYQQVHYVDGDIWLLGPLNRTIAQLDANALLLTPHLLRPASVDHAAVELGILKAGTFNAGYIAATPLAQSLGILDWWRERVGTWGYNEPRLGMCGDQRWLDPVPYLFDRVVVCRDPGINVGYWRAPLANLAQGTAVAASPSGAMHAHIDTATAIKPITVDSVPLTMLHLSGFDPRTPARFSRFAPSVTQDSDGPGAAVLAGLLRAYAERLLANGWAQDRRVTYTHARWWHRSSLGVRLLRAAALALRQRRAARTGE